MRKLALFAGTILAMTGTAQAQTQTPAFRVPIGQSATASAGPPVYAWMQTVGTCSSSCGTGTRTTTYQCQDTANYDFSGSGYGAAEADSFCSASSPKPSPTTASCTNYSGCSYTWVKPTPVVTILAKPDPNGGSFEKGAVNDCSYAKRTFSPYCQRDGSPAVQMAAGDYQFCKNDRPNYDDVANGVPDARGYDRTTDVSTACTTGARDNAWKTGAWGAASSDCSIAPTHSRTVQCYRKFDGVSQSDATCAGITKPATTETMAADFTGCFWKWETGSWSAYSSTCSDNATRTRSVACKRSDGTTVADAMCFNDGPKPASSETSSNYVGCSYDWGTPGAWTAPKGCSATLTRTRTVSCVRSNGTSVADSYCNAATKPSTSEQVSNYDTCTYTPRDQGATACSNAGQRQQYWDCTRSDGQTGFPASYCGKTNPETQTCTPPVVYTYSPHNRGMGACDASRQRPQYWDCDRSDGGTGYPASNCGKTNPEMVSCTYTANKTGESACSNTGQKSVYWNCIGSDGNTYDASYCGHSSTETAACTPPVTYSPRKTGEGACQSNSTKQVYWDCLGSDNQSYPASYCGKTNPETQGCTYVPPVTYSWQTGGYGAYSSTCSDSATRTRSVWCGGSDGQTYPDANCSGAKPASSETTGVYSGCGYTVEDTSSSNCVSGTRTYSTQCRRSDGVVVANSYCGNNGTRTASCSVAPTDCAASVDFIQVTYGNPVSASKQTHVEYYNIAGGSQFKATTSGATGNFTLTNNGETKSFSFTHRTPALAGGSQTFFYGTVGGYQYRFRVGILDSSYRLAAADVFCD